ncbi:MAG: MarR family winged helix-turn-helix transcriptional regulator [Acidovorax temperans]|uniref:MarR family winged helix-turn-helix transcriptional regulator n=1 Tax=Acidovorax temperans TaxID=80878 RepID=UPI00391C536F
MDEQRVPALKNPQNIAEFLVYRLFRLVGVALRGTDDMYKRELGISRREWRILAYLERTPDASLKTLAADSRVDTVVASRLVSTMVERGLLMKQRDPSNKRMISLRLTDLGQQVHGKALSLGTKYNRRLASCLSDDEARALESLFLKLERQAEVVDLTHE